MASVRVIHSVKVGERTYNVKEVKPFLTMLVQSEIEATSPQLHVLAHEARDLLFDKILAGNPRGHPLVFKRMKLPKRVSKGLVPKGRLPFPFDARYPLDKDYLDRKVGEGNDPRPLIATGAYLRGIKVQRVKQGTLTAWHVRMKRGIHKPSGMPYNRFARLMEYGSAAHGLPPRSHWRQAWKIVKEKHSKLRETIRAQALREALRKIK